MDELHVSDSKSKDEASRSSDLDVLKQTGVSSSSSVDGTEVVQDGHGEVESASKEVNIDTNPEDVKAPNLFERIKEEVEAITQNTEEKHSNDKEHSGFFHWLASKLGINMHHDGGQSK